MIDDRMETASSKQYMEVGSWTGKNNVTAWDWVLDGNRGGKDVSIYAAPARAKDLSGLPTTWINCGAAELFRDENVEYATKLWEHGVQCELHVWQGGWHAYDIYALGTGASNLVLAERMAWMKRVLLAPAPVPDFARAAI